VVAPLSYIAFFRSLYSRAQIRKLNSGFSRAGNLVLLFNAALQGPLFHACAIVADAAQTSRAQAVPWKSGASAPRHAPLGKPGFSPRGHFFVTEEER